MNEGLQPRPRIDRAEGEVEDPDMVEEESPASLDDDEQLQREVIDKIKTACSKGKSNRMAEVGNARDQRLYFKGIQQFYWSEDSQDVIFDSEDDSPYDRVFNVFQGYGKIFQSTFMGARPKVRAEADDPFDSTSIRNTGKAQIYERIYRKNNDTPTQQAEAARLFWTDGRTVTRTLSRNGKEITEFWGVLESRLPATAKDDIEVPLKNCALIELEDEYPIVQLKRDYPDARKKINSGNGDSYERNARLAVKRQAGSDTAIDVQTGEDSYGLATKTWSYMRPEFFEEFQESSRVQLEEMFPSGLCVVRNGDVYLESYECDPDSCLDVIHALPGDGMSRGSIGQPMMPLQDSANTGQNLIEETFDHGIPTTYYDTKTDIDGLNKQREMPGASRKATGLQGQPLSNAFWQTQAINPSQQLMNYVEDLKGPQSQFATGQQPALFGGDMTDQKTASGYAQARTMALGQMAIVWKPYTAWFAREMTRAVKMASQGPEEIKSLLPSSRPGGRAEAARILPGELTGLGFSNESDENFPETWTEKSNKVMSLLQDPDFKQLIIANPANWYFVKEMIGLPELSMTGETILQMVLADIAQMEHEQAQPDPSQMPAAPFPPVGQQPRVLQAMNGQMPTPTPLVSSITIDGDLLEPDDYKTGWEASKEWLLQKGEAIRTSNPKWYQNVKLYAMQWKKGMIAAQQAAAPPPEPPDLPKVMIPYDSLPVSGKIQAAAKAEIQLTPADIASVPAKPIPGQPPAGAMNAA